MPVTTQKPATFTFTMTAKESKRMRFLAKQANVSIAECLRSLINTAFDRKRAKK